MKLVAFIFALFSLSLIITNPVSANHTKDVLGDTTAPSDMDFPQIAAGPGFFLPDSPFYFLDNLSQRAKIAFAFTPEKKAQIRNKIAGERLAELRVMLERDNREGIMTALTNFTKESELAAADLSDAGARSGQDIRPIAKELNTTIKANRKVLRELERQTSGDLRLHLQASRESLKRAKVAIDDELSPEELEKELQEDLDEIIADEVDEASRSARGLEHAVDVLERLASQAAEKNQPEREAALRRVIEKKSAKIENQEQRQLEREQNKRERKVEQNQKAIKEARESVKQAQEAAMRFRQARQEIKAIDEAGESENDAMPLSGSGNSRSANPDQPTTTSNKNPNAN